MSNSTSTRAQSAPVAADQQRSRADLKDAQPSALEEGMGPRPLSPAERAAVAGARAQQSSARGWEHKASMPTLVLRLQQTEGNRAVQRLLQRNAASPAPRSTRQNIVVMRQAEGGAPAPDPLDAGAPAADAGYVTFEGKQLALSPEQQRRDLEEVVAKEGVDGPDQYLQEWELTIDRSTPLAGVPENQADLDKGKKALESLRTVVAKFKDNINTFIHEFGLDARATLTSTLDDSQARANAEAMKYGLTEEEIKRTTYDPQSGAPLESLEKSYDFANPKSAQVAGVAEAAKQLLKRRSDKIDPLKKKLSELNARMYAGARRESIDPGEIARQVQTAVELGTVQQQIGEEESSYDVLANDMAQRYPILGSFTHDKDDLSGLQTLAAGGTHDAAQLIGEKIRDTLTKIKQVRDENKEYGGVEPYKLPKIVALTKGRENIGPNSWQNRIVDEHIDHIHHVEAITGIALGLLQLVLTLLAPATGGASLIVVAGLGTASAVEHAKKYMLEDAMAGSDVDKAKALSQDDPSLFWLAVDIVATVSDVGAGAAAAAKLLGTWRTAVNAVRAVEAAKTAEELNVARNAMSEALKDEPELLARISKKIEQKGGLLKQSEEVKAVEGAVEKATEAEMKGGVQVGKVHVTGDGRLFSCNSPCAELREKYADLLASKDGKSLLADLNTLEKDSAKAVSEGKKGAALKSIAERTEALEAALEEALVKAKAKKIATWIDTIKDDHPALKNHPLDIDAIERLVRKGNPDHVKGQLLEELMATKIQQMVDAGGKGLEKFAGGRPVERLEFIAGHRISDSKGQFTDGMLIIRDGNKVEVVAIFEAKAGKASSRGLVGEYTPLKQDGSYKSLADLGAERKLKELDEAEMALISARQEAIETFRQANPARCKGMTIEQIDVAPELQADLAKVMDKMVKTEAGQAVHDIERLVELGFKIDNKTVELTKGGRASSKVVGVMPDDVGAGALESKIGEGTLAQPAAGGKPAKPAKPGQGVNFATDTVGVDAKELNELANEIADRVAAPL